jgi:hypothetical protein
MGVGEVGIKENEEYASTDEPIEAEYVEEEEIENG